MIERRTISRHFQLLLQLSAMLFVVDMVVLSINISLERPCFDNQEFKHSITALLAVATAVLHYETYVVSLRNLDVYQQGNRHVCHHVLIYNKPYGNYICIHKTTRLQNFFYLITMSCSID